MLIGATAASALSFTAAPKKRLIKPRRLRKGQTIGLITPGSFLADEGLQKAVTNLENLGFQVKMGKNIRAEMGYVAGTDPQRLADLHDMVQDSQVDAIWCARGGYGCSRLLPYIQYDLFKKYPKALIGYSDITALHVAIHQATGLVTFHGPVGASDFTEYTALQLQKVLMEPEAGPSPVLRAPGEDSGPFAPYTIRPGVASGPLMGGNLSLLSALAGTDFQAKVKGKLLFVEEVGEKPYRVDRMLVQLLQSCDVRQAAGIMLGVFADCEAAEGDRSLSLSDTLKGQLAGLGIPVAYGISFGHVKDQCTLPLGIPAQFDAGSLQFRLLEPAVM